MRLIWDDKKRLVNLQKHGVDFAAAENFAWDTAIMIEDVRHDYGETRFQVFGFVGKRLHSLVFTRRGDAVRLISLRKANSRESARYEEAKKASRSS